MSQQNNATFKSSFLAADFGNGVEGVGRRGGSGESPGTRRLLPQIQGCFMPKQPLRLISFPTSTVTWRYGEENGGECVLPHRLIFASYPVRINSGVCLYISAHFCNWRKAGKPMCKVRTVELT